jgi:3-methyladenine DNA glycosylase AlkD
MALTCDVATLVERIDGELQALGTAERAAHEKAYLKSSLLHYGVSVPDVRKLAKTVASREGLTDHDELVELTSALWDNGIYEQRAIAVEFLALYRRLLVAEDLALIEELLRRSYTWALVDHLAETIVGFLLTRYPELGTQLDRWTSDEDFWIRRSALLALLRPLRDGGGDFARFARYADSMIEEKEFFIRKAIGWVLRETGKKQPDLVTEWLLPRAKLVSGLTFREAVRRLPEDKREQLLAARNA